MFSITLICMGKLKEKFYTAAAEEYAKRMKAYCAFQLLELPECRLPDDPNGTQIAAGLAREAEQIEAKPERLIAVQERLPDRADQPADPEGVQQIFPRFRPGRQRVHIAAVFLL